MIRKDTLKVAIVGARKCSPYGESMAIRFAERLAEQGIEIISGLARGVDGAGQRGALNVGGCSYGVLGSGRPSPWHELPPCIIPTGSSELTLVCNWKMGPFHCKNRDRGSVFFDLPLIFQFFFGAPAP